MLLPPVLNFIIDEAMSEEEVETCWSGSVYDGCRPCRRWFASDSARRTHCPSFLLDNSDEFSRCGRKLEGRLQLTKHLKGRFRRGQIGKATHHQFHWEKEFVIAEDRMPWT